MVRNRRVRDEAQEEAGENQEFVAEEEVDELSPTSKRIINAALHIGTQMAGSKRKRLEWEEEDAETKCQTYVLLQREVKRLKDAVKDTNESLAELTKDFNSVLLEKG
ncbi:MAG: hypothetical protein AAGC43_18060 [Bacteroidota bacterium]